jgi:hypothetical protein
MIEMYDREKHLEMIGQWYDRRGQKRVLEYLYPPTGFVVPDTAAGFLAKTDSGFAIMENFISNPQAYEVDREVALKSIIFELEHVALEAGYQYLMAYSDSERIGFYADFDGGKVIAEATIYGKEL